MSNDEPKGIPSWLIGMVIFSIIVVLLLLSLYFLRFSDYLAKNQAGYGGHIGDFVGNIINHLQKDSTAWGTFGDYVGGILNPLFSFTALFALLYTIKLQSKELHESTEQLKASAEALALQNSVMARQQFENTFFQMLGLFNEVVKAMELRFTNNASDKSFKGRLCIFRLLEELIQSVAGIQAESLIKDKYYAIYNEYNFLLGHYFRTLYSIIKFVDNSKLSDLDKKFYTNIVRAQLSEHELALLFYNCIYLDEAQEKFLPLVRKYKLLKHLNKKILTNPAHRQLLGF